MTRSVVLCCVLLAVGSEASAGLLDALRTSLTGLQAAETTISVSGNNLPAPLPPRVTPAQLLFVDPINSTTEDGVYGSGPSFEYDAETGAVGVFAPPLLSGPDEFGLRTAYSPVAVTVVFGGTVVDAVSPPEIRLYRDRESPGLLSLGASGGESDSSNSSFVVEQGSSNLRYHQTRVRVHTYLWNEFGGADVSFDRLLPRGLTPADFVTNENSFEILNGQSLEGIYALVDYDRLHGTRSVSSGLPRNILAVATPDFSTNAAAIPEPSSVVLLVAVFAVALLPRRFAPRVA